MPKGILLGNDKDNEREQRQHEASGGDVILGVKERSVAEEDEEGRQHQQPAINIPHFGRPKGTTESYSREVQERVRLATIAAAKEYKAVIEMTKMSKHRQRLRRGTLRSIIARAKETYNVQDHIRISEYTIRSRCRRNCVHPPVQQGTPSPMLGIEPHLVELIIQLARMRCPINVTAGLQLANSLIAGTPIAEQLVKWKITHNVQTRRATSMLATPGTGRTDDTTTRTNDEVVSLVHAGSMSAASSPLLGWGYWRGFMKRNGHVIKSKL
jgi:hypothetical protein